MKNLTGITLNGEWLGNNVLINSMFRSICTISPIVMQEFIHIINGIDQLEDAVSIQNFNCKDKNSIDIEFANKELCGLASLYFTMNDGNPELINSFLKLDKKEDIVTENAIEVIEESIKSKPAKNKRRKSKKNNQADIDSKNDYSNDADYNYAEDNEYIEDTDYDNNYDEEQDVVNYYDTPAYNNCDDSIEYQAGSYDGYAEDDEQQVQIKYANITIAQEDRGNSLARQQDNEYYEEKNINDLIDKSEEVAIENNCSHRDNNENASEYLDNKKEFDSKARTEEDKNSDNNNVNRTARESSATARHERNSQPSRQRGMRPQNLERTATPVPSRGNTQGRGQGRISADSDLQQIVITANSINITPSDFEQNGRKSRGHNLESAIEDNTKNRNINDNEITDTEANKEFIENNEENKDVNKNDHQIIIPEIINENYNPEDISEFLADFYTSDKIEAEITREQALLKEIQSLKEEINELHGQKRGSEEEEEETPMTLEEFYARQLKKAESKANTYGYTFRIVGTNKRLRANVVDPELFIAGDKLYRWGEKLYLEN